LPKYEPNTISGSCRQDNEIFDRCGGCEGTCTNPNVTFHFCFTISPFSPFVQRSVILTTLVAVAEKALSETETAVVFVRAAAPITILLRVVEMKFGMNVVDVKQPATIPM
jgi:hypothetical protein